MKPNRNAIVSCDAAVHEEVGGCSVGGRDRFYVETTPMHDEVGGCFVEGKDGFMWIMLIIQWLKEMFW